jgi:branched-chain amino acid transport system ATP-binding protein
VLQVQQLTKRFGGFTAVSGISFDLAEGEILGLIGPNGSGKSTTFNLIAGLYAPTSGSIKLQGREIGGLKPAQICHAGIGRTFQIPRPFRKLGILENVALSAYYGQAGKVTRAKAWEQAEEALELIGLPYAHNAQVEGLGAAALKKLEMARALATQPRILLADESLGGLDEAEMNQAADMLMRVRREKNITIIWVEHIMGVLMRVVDRVLVLDHGEIIAAGLPHEVAKNPRVVEVYLGTDAAEVQANADARQSGASTGAAA